MSPPNSPPLTNYHKPGTSPNPCATRWRNMSVQHTSKMWGVFDESGIFIALCRHGFVLSATDMVKSGELYVPVCFYVL